MMDVRMLCSVRYLSFSTVMVVFLVAFFSLSRKTVASLSVSLRIVNKVYSKESLDVLFYVVCVVR